MFRYRLSIVFLLLCTSFWPSARSEDWPSRQQISLLVSQLSDDDVSIRDSAARSLTDFAWKSVDCEWKDGRRTGDASADAFRQELLASKPLLLEVVKQSNPDSPDSAAGAAVACLAVSDKDGAILRSAICADIRGHARLEWYAIHTLMWTTLYTMPEDAAAFPLVLRHVQTMSPELRDFLAATWRDFENDSPEKEGAAPIKEGFAQLVSLDWLGQALIETNRTLKELPFLIECLDAQYPNIFRVTAAKILGDLEEEGSGALPSLRQLLNDQSAIVRLISAASIVQIERNFSDVSTLAGKANLSDKDRAAFLDWARGFEQESQVNDSEDAIRVLISLPYSFYQRQGLRVALKSGVLSDSDRPRVQELIGAEHESTRELAKKAIQLPSRQNSPAK